MKDKTFLTASHIRYLIALKKLDRKDGIKSCDVARELSLTKASVHNMMDTFLDMRYIKKEPGGRVFLTRHGLEKALLFENYCIKIKQSLFCTVSDDNGADTAVYAFLANLPEKYFSALSDKPQNIK